MEAGEAQIIIGRLPHGADCCLAYDEGFPGLRPRSKLPSCGQRKTFQRKARLQDHSVAVQFTSDPRIWI